MKAPSSDRLRAAVALALLAAVAACAPEAPAGTPPIAPAELADRLAAGTAPVILDVRSPEEYEAGHIPGAVNVPHDQLAAQLESLDLPKSSEVVLHCERGGRAREAEEVLNEAGYSHVRDLSGHMQVWRAKGLPVE